MRQELTFNGKALSDFGVWFDGSVSFGSPERDVELVEVFGRDGALSISNDRFRNIEITFPCAIRTNFIDNYRNLMAFLNSSKGYCRLETTQEPNYYRLALFMNQTDPTGYKLNTHGRFDLVFQVMPQRFLKSGETSVPVSSVTETTSGNPAYIRNISNLTKVTGLQADIEPVQNLNGYDHPWVGGTGKNLLPSTIYNLAGNTGTIVSNSAYRSMMTEVTGGETYTISRDIISGNRFYIYGTETKPADGVATHILAHDNTALTLTFTTAETDKYILVYLANDKTEITSKIQLETGSTATAYEPYENICPITGHTQAVITASQKNLLQNNSSSSVNHGITFTKQTDGTVVASGTADADASFIINFDWTLDSGDYQLSGCAEGGATDKYYCFLWDRSTRARAKDWNGNTSESSFNPTQIVPVRLEKGVNYGFYCRVCEGVTVNNIIFYPMICAKGHSTQYARYNVNTVTVNLDGTIYGGTLNVTTGVLTVTDANIASYNGETLPSTWISDRDVYASGTAPTTGAQVVYKLATPTTVQLTAHQLSLLNGVNYVFANTGDVTVEITSPATLTNPTLFESKPIIRVWGNGTLNVNSYYITVANSPYTYIDIDCELMDCYYGSNNANQYVSFSTTDYVTLKSGANYFSYSGFSGVHVTPRWFEI